MIVNDKITNVFQSVEHTQWKLNSCVFIQQWKRDASMPGEMVISG